MNSKINKQIAEAVQFFQMGNLTKSELLLNKIISKDKNNLPALRILALIATQNRNAKLAVELMRKAVKIDSQDGSLQYNLAKALMDLNLDSEALAHHEFAVKLMPKNYQAWLNFGICLARVLKYEKAAHAFKQCLAIDKGLLEGWLNLAAVHIALGQYQEAIHAYDEALKLDSRHLGALLNRGFSKHSLEKYEDALLDYENALAIDHHYADAWNNKALTLKSLFRPEAALGAYEMALKIKPDYVNAWLGIGNILQESNQFEKAAHAFKQCLAIDKGLLEGWLNLAAVHIALGQYQEAIHAYDEALKLDSRHLGALLNRGFSKHSLEKYEDALLDYENALAIDHHYADAWNNKALTLKSLFRPEAALGAYEMALKIKPDYVNAWLGIGNILQESNQFMPALASYERAFTLAPDTDYLFGDLIHVRRILGIWKDYQNDNSEIIKRLDQDKKTASPFMALTIIDSQALQFKVANQWIKHKLINLIQREKIINEDNKKIKIAYVSADFGSHPVGYLTANLFELHNREKFELYGFSLRKRNNDDIYTRRIAKSFDHFLTLENKTDSEIAKLSRDFGIDIAIDLGGHTLHARTGIFAYGAAPIQVNFLGYPGTIGGNYMDYIIADKILIPEKNHPYFSEKIAYLPDTYMPNDSLRNLPDKIFTRTQLGLPEEGFIFCCFNNSYKITLVEIESWAKIMLNVNNSYLWISENNNTFAENLIQEFIKLGIDPLRIVFAKRLDSLDEHLARYSNADLFLDTFSYNAHTTASDALWAGLPVLTQIGKTFPGRVAASLLTAVGLPELITHTPEEYEALAIDLAQHPEKLQQIKQKLAENRLVKPLFDTKKYVTNLENLYEQMMLRYKQKKLPDHIHI